MWLPFSFGLAGWSFGTILVLREVKVRVLDSSTGAGRSLELRVSFVFSLA